MTLPPYVFTALEALEAAGWESYAVGGCVRDSLLGLEPQDWDLTTAAPPAEVKRVFANQRTLDTGLRHGTVTLLRPEGALEITTFRTEGGYSDARHPDSVAFVSNIHEDLRRRDFTVNAMAYSPFRGLRDDFGGEADLRSGLLRCVGAPEERFREDALRILRGLRFAGRYGFAIEPETARALRNSRAGLAAVSPERIFSELKGILVTPGAGTLLREYPEVFFTFLPELAPCRGFDQHRPAHHQWDVWEHITRTVEFIEPETILRLTMLFHDAGKPDTFTLDEKGVGRFYGHPGRSAALADVMLRRLRCDNYTRETVTRLVENHEMLTGHTRPALRRLLAELGEEDMRRLLAVRRADALAHTPATAANRLALTDEDERIINDLLAREGRLTISALAIGGGELRGLGVPAGPEIGRILRRLWDEVLDEKVQNNRPALLARAEELNKEEAR